MKAGLISFTRNGRDTAKKINRVLKEEGWAVAEDVKSICFQDSYSGSLKNWTEEHWKEDALIFVGAVGIAVRAIAPFVVSKKEDPAVIVVDEHGKYCIPILSGHIGGANEVAGMLGEKLSIEAVITTATDLNHKWAVDVFAKKNGLVIDDMKKAKEVSANLLAGKSICLYLEPEGRIQGQIPEEVKIFDEEVKKDESCMEIQIGVRKYSKLTDRKAEIAEVLHLVPKVVILGIGCKKGTDAEAIEKLVDQVLCDNEIYPEAVKLVASIDLKKEEPGLCEFCEKQGISFRTFSKEELEQVKGTFESSEFVRQITGVDNVCERSARCAGGEKILVHKTAKDGVTVAVAVEKWSVNFE